MVTRLIQLLTWVLILAGPVSGLASPFAGAQELTVEPDRTRLYEGEVLTLTVKGSMKLDINLSNLFDFNLSDLPSPDIEKAEPDFKILARNQQYSIRTVNDEMVGEITWTYQLAPTTTGKLTIPSLSFRGAHSEPVTIEVVDGTPPDQAAGSRDSFIELSTDKAEVYVQEQLALTVRLFFRGNLIRGELSEPQHPNAIIEPLGKQREFSRYRDGLRYRVVERRYAIFPQQPGTLSLAPIRFEGQARDTAGNLKFLRDSEQLFEVPVKDIPATFSGDTWLPSQEVTLASSGLPSTLVVETGENLTRTLVLSASGLPSAALPPLPDTVPEGLRSYPEQPERTTSVTPDGLTSRLSQTYALVPVSGGQVTLPAIRIPWWDTESDIEKVAVLPARTLTVSAPAASESTEPTDPTTTPPSASGDKPQATSGDQPREVSFWPWLSAVLATLWLLTTLAWWWSRRARVSNGDHLAETGSRQEKAIFDRLSQAAREGSPSTVALVVEWANLRFPGHGFHTTEDLTMQLAAPELGAELKRLQAHHFAPDHGTETWNGRNLTAALRSLREQRDTPALHQGLPPLYPDHLATRATTRD
ncbi:MAG TPA: BatD family protein [Marinobacter sp.]|uniref:BatD family protein n=1 Tax=Marinobacter sp. TaxID=50741 RepID=UPI002D80A190|nr:BatD family protein [Marinobacter sp.]HET8799701.1 BatD family protein [Marinobacter sp.]